MFAQNSKWVSMGKMASFTRRLCGGFTRLRLGACLLPADPHFVSKLPLLDSPLLERPSESGQCCRCSDFSQIKTAIGEGSVGQYGYRTVFGAESQAAPESKGEALGQWQHGPGEATSGLVGFSGTGCHVDTEPRLSSILSIL